MLDRYSTLRNGLVGAWCPSLGATGRRIVDRSPYKVDATLVGSPAWRANAVDLSASSTYGDLPDRPWYAIQASGFSVSAWFSATTTSLTFNDVIACKEQVASPYLVWGLRGTDTGSGLRFVVSSTTTNYGALATSTDLGLTTNTWYHVCGTFDGQNARLYFNGSLRNTSSAFSGTVLTTTAPPRIGDSYGYSGRQFPGLLDDIRLYSRALTQSEIATLASARGVGMRPQRHRRGVAPTSTKQISVRVGGSWLPATPYVNVGGTWQLATPYTRQGGVWN